LPQSPRQNCPKTVLRLSGSDGTSPDEVYQRALNLLARRDHSVAELRRKLVSRGFPDSRVSDALERLLRQGYLDDRRFAEHWVESALRSGKGYGNRLLLELLRRGVSRETAAEAIAGAACGYGERQLLDALMAKRFSGFDPASAPLKERRRVHAYLLRRGFSSSAIRAYFDNLPDD